MRRTIHCVGQIKAASMKMMALAIHTKAWARAVVQIFIMELGNAAIGSHIVAITWRRWLAVLMLKT
jgi:hypothetical protein